MTRLDPAQTEIATLLFSLPEAAGYALAGGADAQRGAPVRERGGVTGQDFEPCATHATLHDRIARTPGRHHWRFTMTDFAALVDALIAHKDPSDLTLAPPASAAEWERCQFVYTGIDLPDDVRSLYNVANGFATGWIEPIIARWKPLPIERPRFGVSMVAPCRPEAQLPLFEYSRAWLALLLEGDHQGEVWVAGHADPEALGHTGRVARNLEELFEHLTIAAIQRKFVTDAASAAELYPGINTFLLGGNDTRPLQDIKTDGGWPPIYQPVTSPEWEDAWYQLDARKEAWIRNAVEWQQQHFPGHKKTPPPT